MTQNLQKSGKKALAKQINAESKRCPRCDEFLSLTEFGVCRARKDGVNLYCKKCIREKIALSKQALREYKQARNKQGFPAQEKTRATIDTTQGFSPRRIARILRKLSPGDRVREAIRCGARTQKEITRVTKLPKEEVCDALANLLLWTHEIRTEVVNHQRVYLLDELPSKETTAGKKKAIKAVPDSKAIAQTSYQELKRKQELEREDTRAFIAHEFRHALTPLNAYVKILEEALAQPELSKERLLALASRIRKQSDTAFALVDQYLEYSRPLTPRLVQIDINDLMQQTLEGFKAELKNRGIGFELQFAEAATANADKHLLAHVFRNVMANAIQAIDHDGKLTLSTERYGDDVLVTIRDNGRGIKPEHISHLFELGFTTKPGMRGAGFGLAVSKKLIEDVHSGSISITNNAPKPGVSVAITLPKQPTETRNGRHGLTLAHR